MPDDHKHPLQEGDRVLDRYVIQDEIALGGHSVVYLGTDERLSRPVCVKAFHKLIEQKKILQTAYEHFVQEAFALSKLTHPNTLRIYDFGQASSTKNPELPSFPIQVSEYMAGGTLSRLVVQDGPVSIHKAIDWMAKLGDALSEAHRLDIVHRDIKPQNILFTTHGRDREPKLADFGIAKSTRLGNMENQAENTEIVVGFPLAMFSPSWASPEQLCGAQPTTTVDIYSLGLVTVFALTGQAICKSSSAQEGYDKRRESEKLVQEAMEGAGIPEPISLCLQKACAFRSIDRPHTASEFSESLRCAYQKHLKDKHQPKKVPALFLEPGDHTLEGFDVGTNTSPKGLPFKKEVVPRIQPNSPLQVSEVSALMLFPRPAVQQINTSSCHFTAFDNEIIVIQLDSIRIRIIYTPNPSSLNGRTITVRGMNCFVAKSDGRPSVATHTEMDCHVDLLSPQQAVLGRIHVCFGQQTMDNLHQYVIGGTLVSLKAPRGFSPILIDSPSHHLGFFLYEPNILFSQIGHQVDSND